MVICFCMVVFGCGTSVKVTTANTTVPVMLGPVLRINGENETLLNENMESFYIEATNYRLLLGEQMNEGPEKFDAELLKIGVDPETPLILSQIQFFGFFTCFQSISNMDAGVRGAIYWEEQ